MALASETQTSIERKKNKITDSGSITEQVQLLLTGLLKDMKTHYIFSSMAPISWELGAEHHEKSLGHRNSNTTVQGKPWGRAPLSPFSMFKFSDSTKR